ncbi:TIGR01212 family radical SAM protein [Anaerococcus ihuae]|uniref:TIGR01212 family radical SAM protein n=1 Tax=Anaerococcus ihuae TaxID=2899519 RepID=UPI001EED5E39|nr:TIGR01212 family radical SAM protein [Anaerococcus ihuae]
MCRNLPYFPISKFYKSKYGEKVYKLPIKLSITCPNRDGEKSTEGCIFCSESGGSFENLPSFMTVDKQLEINKKYIGSRYKAKKFIAYFQNFSNTYMEFDKFKNVINACNKDYIVAISISTRSDCITYKKLNFLKEFSNQTGIDIVIELGLQTANYKSLKILNRCEDLADFIQACNMINEYGFRICTHVILSLPWDDEEDIIETARIINVLGIKEVKIHSLFIIKNTKLDNMYKNKEFVMPTKKDYQKNVILFLRNINKDIAIQRLVGRAPEEDTVFCNWNSSWWMIRDEIVKYMNENNIFQGDLICRKEYKKLKGEMK